MPTPQVNSMGVPDIVRAFSNNPLELYRDARAHKRSVSGWLDQLNPTDSADRSGLDAFGRVMKELGIVSRSQPDRGIYASTFGELHDSIPGAGGRALVVEWMWRQYHRAQQVAPGIAQRALLSGDFTPGTMLRPYADDATLVGDFFQPAIPIAMVVAGSQGLDTDSFRSIFLTEPTAAAKRWYRVGETAEIPRVAIRVGERIISMYKYGKGVEVSYEVLRREPLDRLARTVQLVAVQNEIDKLATIIDILVNGDGNANTAATVVNLTSLDSAAAGKMTLRAWIAFRGKFLNPYQMTTALAQSGPSLDVKLLNVGSANLPISTLPAFLNGQVVPMNNQLANSIALGETPDAPSNKIVGFDKRIAVERLFEIGADIQETERYANNQTQVVFMTEVEGYRIINPQATKVLDLAA